MTQVQRWTGVVSASESGGFVAYGDYLALLDRLEKAEKDAERLDWLNLAGNRFAFYLSGTWYSRKDHGSPYRKQGNIRSAIDAAMKASK